MKGGPMAECQIEYLQLKNALSTKVTNAAVQQWSNYTYLQLCLRMTIPIYNYTYLQLYLRMTIPTYDYTYVQLYLCTTITTDDYTYQ